MAGSYSYDLNGIRKSKTVNGVTYNYLTQNGQVVRQTWGNNILDIIAINPIRYRGYYYDPGVGRFISADEIEYLEDDNNSLEQDLFCSCDNNPVSRKDNSGNVWEIALAGSGYYMPQAIAMVEWLLSGMVAITPVGWGIIGAVARRKFYKSRKQAKEEANRTGKWKPPKNHPKGKHGNAVSHYHPDVKNSYRTTPHGVSSHDHYIYPR